MAGAFALVHQSGADPKNRLNNSLPARRGPVKVAIHTLRKRRRDLFRQDIAGPVAVPAEANPNYGIWRPYWAIQQGQTSRALGTTGGGPIMIPARQSCQSCP